MILGRIIMSKSNTETCLFTINRVVYNIYTNIITAHAENIKSGFIHYETLNSDTLGAIDDK